jgi:hypothetical protein
MSQEKKAPTREEIIKWYKDEIELAGLRADLTKLQRDATVSEAERMRAIVVIAEMTQEPVSAKEPAAPAAPLEKVQ